MSGLPVVGAVDMDFVEVAQFLYDSVPIKINIVETA